MVCTFRFIVSVLSVVVLVTAESGEEDTTSADPKTANKRGLAGLTGVPGVLYGQYSPHVHTVPVPQPYPVPVPHPVSVQVPRPFPVTVHKPVGIPVPVGVPVPVNVPVPKPYPVPVPINIPQGASSLSAFGGAAFGGLAFGGSAFGGSPFGGSPFGGSQFGGSPFGGSPFGGSPFGGSPYGGSPYGGHPSDFGGHFPPSPLEVTGPGSYAGRFGYGLGIYNHPGTPSIPLAHSGLGAHPPPLAGAGSPPFDPTAPHPHKY